ncbi:MAG: ubiquinone biosynthesis protein UbiB [Alphaproteobacteria bacterium]|nr:ubiquinone biosynthesis protein UbiB [Alphaproteobacteria bacterium]
MLDALSDYLRLARAGAVMARHDVIIPEAYKSRAPWFARAAGSVLRLLPGGGARGKRPGQRFAGALERLGPAWIKLGQFMATRPDVIGVEAANDLSRLKDALPPFSGTQAERTLREEFGEDAARLFPRLGPPIAAASIAQVHRIETPEGPKAVKILRPNVEHEIELELRAMRRIARDAERSQSPEVKRMEPVAFVETMARSLTRELDLRLEAGAASEFGEIAAIDGYVSAPAVDWERCSQRVLTTDWIEGKSLTDPGALDGIDRPDLANRITRGFLACALDHGFFHADLHEGNMILASDGRLVLVDFGIMGRIGPDERLFLAEILKGFLERNYTRVAEVHLEAGYVPPNHSAAEFAQALRSVGEPIFGRDARDVSMARVLLQLFDITRQFGMHLRPELVLLQKTMVQVEGVSRAIDPAHNIWQAAKPVVDRWTRREFGPEGIRQIALNAGRAALQRLRKLPETLDRLDIAIMAAANPPPPPAPATRTPGWAWFLAGAVIASAAAAVAWWVVAGG